MALVVAAEVVAFCVLAAWFAICSSHQPNGQSGNSEAEHGPAKLTLWVAAATPSKPETAVAKYYAADEPKEVWLFGMTAEIGLAWLTLLLVIATAYLAFYTAGLVSESKQLRLKAQADTDRQAEEFKQQLAVATEAASASKEQTLAVKRVERAYLFGGLSTDFKFRIADTKIQVVATNSGRTAGIISEFYAELLPFQELGPEPEYPTPECRIKTDTVVPAGKEQPLQSGSLDPKQMLLIGYLKYIDMFRDEHTSRFCLLVHGELMNEKSDKLIAYSYGPPAWGTWD